MSKTNMSLLLLLGHEIGFGTMSLLSLRCQEQTVYVKSVLTTLLLQELRDKTLKANLSFCILHK